MLKYAIVIDDDSINNLICESFLNLSGKVETVRCFLLASEALEWMVALDRADYPEIILLDIHMPIMDGWGFLAALNQRLPEHTFKIAILTSSVSEEDRARASWYPSLVGFLNKPLTLEKISSLWSSLSDKALYREL